MFGVVLSLALFLSGAAGLIFQVVWFHRAGLVLGSSIASVTVVLSAFMGGLALGSLLAIRLTAPRLRGLTLYAVLEHVVAGAGLMTTLLLPHMSGALAAAAGLSSSAPFLDLTRFAMAFVLMAVPSTAMGATLPVMVGAFSGRRGSFGRALGWLYGCNTLGALAGVLLADAVLIERLGVWRSAGVAALMNLSAAWIALALARQPRADSVAEADRSARQKAAGNRAEGPIWSTRPMLWAAGLSGMTLMALEVTWFRFLSLYVLSTTLAASLMVAAVLGGIAIGGLAASRWLRRDRTMTSGLPVLAVLTGLAVALTYSLFRVTTAGTQIGEWYRVLWLAVALCVPTAAMSGVLFTAIGSVLSRTLEPTAAAAVLTLANTVGAVAGPPLAAFVLLPLVGTEGAFLVLSLAYVGVALLVWRATGVRQQGMRSPLTVVLAGLVVLVAVFPYGAMRRVYFPRSASAYAVDGSRVIETREGPSETIFLMAQEWRGQPVYHRLVTNGFSMTGTGVPGLRYMRAFAYWPMLLHREPIQRALLICYGLGVTASAVLQIPSLTSLDIAEISPDIVAMSDVVHPADKHPLRDRRTTLHLEDGRFFLETTRDRFDLITGEPPPPRTPGAVNIYSEEYFRLIRDRLNPGGIASYWVPVGRPNPGTDIDTVIRAFCNVFDDCSLWNATPFDFMLIGSRDASGPIAAEAFTRPWQTLGLAASLREIGVEQPEQVGATFLGDAEFLASLTHDTPPVTDDFPQRLRPGQRPSLSDPRYGSSDSVRDYYRRVLDPGRARASFAASPFIASYWPADLRERSLPYFESQRILNDALWDGGRPLAHIEDLYALLTTTSLRTLPLWVLGSDDVKTRLAERFDDGNGTQEYAKALRSFSGRDYVAAAAYLQRAEQRGLATPVVLALRAFASYLSGDRAGAAALATAAQPQTDEQRHFWLWLGTRLQEGRSKKAEGAPAFSPSRF